MFEDVSDFLARLDARAIDPNEFVEQSGKLIRAARRREANQRYRQKNLPKEASRKANWRKANPDKDQALRQREYDRDYHRPFIGI